MNSETFVLVQERLPLIYFGLLWTFLSFWVAHKCNFWSFPNGISKSKSVYLSQIFVSLSIFLLTQLIILPIASYLFISFSKGYWLPPKELSFDTITQGWMNIIGIVLSTLLVGTYLYFCSFSTKEEVFGRRFYSSLNEKFNDIFLGSVSWFIIFPIVLVVGQLIEIPLHQYFKSAPQDQVAVRFIKGALESWPLFLALTLSVSVIVPCIEEVLFRGLIQCWLKKKMSLMAAIGLTSLIFSFFHFSWSQGISNVELLASLFILSLFLGFIKERQQSILASIALHGTFNFISITMIYLEGIYK